ncbi:glycosyltransferase [Methanosphaera stadtmanae]|uniref:glycosyltransferase n=1 Tax=Methanosphaera stadtmanae TaxID=2317 RepID=UPI0026660DC4|nr:glycosyltransferase [Methanosphaera stadtmanae]
MHPFISVIIPVYNVQFTIESCFLSLKNQTIGFENLEIIFVDDCSTDNSPTIIGNYEKKYDNVKAIYSKENSGVAGKPRNMGMNIATAKYVMFLDPDDTFTVDACEVLYNEIEKSKADIVSGLHSKKNKFNNNEEIFPGLIINTFSDPEKSWSDRQGDVDVFKQKYPKHFYMDSIEDKFSVLGNFGLSSKIFNLDFIKSNNISFPEYIPGEDSVFLFNALINANGIAFINKIIYSYTTFRDGDNKSVSFQVDLDKNLGRIKAYNLMLEISEEKGIVDEYVHYILANKLTYFLKNFIIKPEYIPETDMSCIFDKGYDLFNEVNKRDNGVLSPEFKNIIENIANRNYDETITACYEYKRKYFSNIVKVNKKTIPFAKDMNVAVVLDPFTYNSYSNEFNAIPVEPENWHEKFEREDIDLFFCESAFSGVGEGNLVEGIAVENNYSPWGGKIGVNLIHGWDSRNQLMDILKYCKEHGIPTIFWNKEDPTSFDNPNYNFIDTALHFDYIFTTDEDSIIRYRARGHENVHVLLFASQINLFNPISTKRSNDIIFAGSWYNQFENRCKTMCDFFDKVINSKYGLKIYNRASDSTAENRMFPAKYDPFIYPKVSFDKMPSVYKESKMALNINTVTDSHTMFARRVYELMSSNTFILSNYSKGIYELFKDNVIYLDRIDSLDLSEEEISKICEENLYDVLQNHTYSNRFKYILNCIGFKYKESIEEVNIIYKAENDDEIDEIIADFNSIDYYYKNCFILSKNVNLKKSVENKDNNITFMDYENIYFLSENSSDENYFLFRNMDNKINSDFIKKALLHYKYLENNIGIKENNEKYVFNKTREYEDTLFNMSQFDNIIEVLLKYRINKFSVYNI